MYQQFKFISIFTLMSIYNYRSNIYFHFFLYKLLNLQSFYLPLFSAGFNCLMLQRGYSLQIFTVSSKFNVDKKNRTHKFIAHLFIMKSATRIKF